MASLAAVRYYQDFRLDIIVECHQRRSSLTLVMVLPCLKFVIVKGLGRVVLGSHPILMIFFERFGVRT